MLGAELEIPLVHPDMGVSLLRQSFRAVVQLLAAERAAAAAGRHGEGKGGALSTLRGVNPVTCNYGAASFYVTIVQCVAAAVLLGVSSYVLWGISDVFYIKQEFIFALAVGLPLFFLWIASEVLSWSGLAISDFWVGLGENLFLLCGIFLPIYGTHAFSRALGFRKVGENRTDQASVTSSSQDDFHFVLTDSLLLDKLRQFMIQSWSIEVLLFLQKAQEYHEAPSDQKESLAKAILEGFIREGEWIVVIVFLFHDSFF